jgi:hypothetical protein
MTPDIDMDNVVLAVLLVAVMLVSMRLLYGYWPWQLHPKLKLQRNKVVKQLATEPGTDFDFQPITASPILGVANENGDTFVRQTGGEPETTSPPKGTNRTEENL